MNDKSKPTAVFCDFDGTITRRDVGYNLFKHFSAGRSDEIVPLWKNGLLTTRECLLQEAAMCRVETSEVAGYLDEFQLNAGFEEFASRCRRHNIDLTIVSDGLDFYINRILGRYQLDYLPLIANHGCIVGDAIKIEFPHDNTSCRRCGSCKGERIREYRQQQDHEVLVVFVGDGLSDVCAAAEADVVLAKKDLERHCRMNNIDFTPYDDFHDVTRYLREHNYLE
ncbi:MAG: MtnX-like HAD-IB family phosphatase [bacterium]